MKGISYRSRAGLAVLLAFSACTAAQSAQPQAASEVLVSWTEHAERIAALKTVLADCAAHATQCDANRVGQDETVQLDGKTVTHIRLEWLRSGIRRLGTETGPSRAALAKEIAGRMTRLETPGEAVSATAMQQARGQLNQVLATREFAPDPPPNWLARQWKAFVNWLVEALTQGFMVASNAPTWLRFFFEALLFLIPALLLFLWLMRQVREDRLHPVESSQTQRNPAHVPQTEWLALAEQFASTGDWRQAIHALYWATISGFESKQIWRSNRARTPREYLRLLDPASSARVALAEQTRLFELTWYGYRSATAADYDRATQLRSAMEPR